MTYIPTDVLMCLGQRQSATHSGAETDYYKTRANNGVKPDPYVRCQVWRADVV
jgi:hypothetical protein